MASPDEIQICVDRDSITQLFARYCHIIDDLLFERLGEVFTPDAVFDYSSLGTSVKGQPTLLDGIPAFERFLRGTMADVGPGLSRFMTNHLIDVRGDEADVTSHSTVLNLPQGGLYRSHAVRTPEGWRIDKSVHVWRDYSSVASKVGFDFTAIRSASANPH